MRAVIISGGKINDYDYIKRQIKLFKADILVCADNGYNHAVKMGLDINLLVGDFDSIGEIPGIVKTIRYPAEKNNTDTEIALSHARNLSAREFLFVGMIGSRADHTLTNIFLLKKCLSRGEDAEIIDEHNRIRITETKLSVHVEKGWLVSLVPLCDCFGVTTEGLAYPLANDTLKFGEGRGVSNVPLGEKASVRLEKGTLMVVIARD